ncbi:hypothetical protein ACF0H5_001480 [Mactra antiquata]
MAASGMEREDSMLEAHRTSLLEVIEDKNRANSKKNQVHRVVYIGRIKEGVNADDRTEIGNHHERLIKNLQNNFQHAEPITGLLLVYLKHLVHVVETSSDMILELIRDAVSVRGSEDGFLEQAKILVVSKDISFINITFHFR